MKSLLLLAAFSVIAFADDLQVFGRKWTVPIGADWKVEHDGTADILRMLVARPSEKPRRPTQFALADTPAFHNVSIETDVKRIGKSIIIVYAYKDEQHFNYAHLSSESGIQQPVHNGIFHVYGGDRARISADNGPASIPSADEWYHVRLDYDGANGTVDVKVNGKSNPSLHAVDLSLSAGKVGIGSFFETALFKNVTITGK